GDPGGVHHRTAGAPHRPVPVVHARRDGGRGGGQRGGGDRIVQGRAPPLPVGGALDARLAGPSSSEDRRLTDGYFESFFAFFAWRFSFRLCWGFFLTFEPPLSLVPMLASRVRSPTHTPPGGD